MKAWWNALSARERLALMVGAYGLGLILVWFGAVRPLQSDNARLRHAVAQASHDYAWMQRAARQVRALRDPGAGGAGQGQASGGVSDAVGKGGLIAALNASLARAGLADQLQSMRPDGSGRVYLVLKGCAYADLGPWLRGLGRAGIDVAQAQLSRQAPGEVDARLSLRRGGG